MTKNMKSEKLKGFEKEEGSDAMMDKEILDRIKWYSDKTVPKLKNK